MSIESLKQGLPSLQTLAETYLQACKEKHKYNCIFCGSSDAFHIPLKGRFRCFSCSVQGDNLDLWNQLQGTDTASLVKGRDYRPINEPAGEKQALEMPIAGLQAFFEEYQKLNSGEISASNPFMKYWSDRAISLDTVKKAALIRPATQQSRELFQALSEDVKTYLGLQDLSGNPAKIFLTYNLGCIIPMFDGVNPFPVYLQFCRYEKGNLKSRYSNAFSNDLKRPALWYWYQSTRRTINRVITTEGIADFLSVIQLINGTEIQENTLVLCYRGKLLNPENVFFPAGYALENCKALILQDMEKNIDNTAVYINVLLNKYKAQTVSRLHFSEQADFNDYFVNYGKDTLFNKIREYL